jgi:hypothetical protein
LGVLNNILNQIYPKDCLDIKYDDNILTISSRLHGYEIWTLKQKGHKNTKDSRDEIHETHRIEFIRS